MEGACVTRRGDGKYVKYFNRKFENLGADVEKYGHVFICMATDKV